jgi:TolB-like protein/DNA-binding winged helix-turn-helix (wHTH) protein
MDRKPQQFRLAGRRVDPEAYAIETPEGWLHVKPRSMAVLEYLARHPGAVCSRRQIMDGVWGPAEVTDDVLTQAVRELRMAFDDDGRNPAFIETIPRGGYRLIAEVEPGVALSGRWSRKWAGLGLGLLVLSAGIALWIALSGRPVDAGQRKIAVLPFEYKGQEASFDYFADGLTEELINSLTQLKELRVTARTSAFHFKGKALPVAEIADQLGVDYVVEGMVRRSGKDLRISAQLIRADKDFHLWSRTYDRELTDLFEIQHDIAERVAEALGILLDEAKRQRMRAVGVKDIEAFLAYQKGWELHRRAHAIRGDRFYPMMIKANTWFDRAIDRAPGFSEAYSARADLYSHLVRGKVFHRPIAPEAVEIAPRAEQLLRRDWDAAYRTAASEARRAAIDIARTLAS